MEERIGIIMNGVTGRMGTNQHLIRSILAIREQGGVPLPDGTRLMPDPILVGRNQNKLDRLAAAHDVSKTSTNLDAVLSDNDYPVYFDSTATELRTAGVKAAIAAGKSIYCEKPTATTLEDAVSLYRAAESAGVKNGVVQDKLWLPGLRKLRYLIDTGFFGRILSVRGEFGYWVFDGEHQPMQRPSWNYRAERGGGIMIDMFCHWRYVIDNLFGRVTSVNALAATHVPERIDESGNRFTCTADDSAYGLFQTDGGVVCQFNSSWAVRVRRDDLFVMQVDGTNGTAVAGLRECWVQSDAMTPKPVWNPDIDSPIDYYADWSKVPTRDSYENAFKVQWELYLKHVARDQPFPWDLRAGAAGVQLAELGMRSSHEARRLEVPALP